jgi:hypothetical protein
MAKISTYIIDSTPQLTDKVIGTDVTDNDITKNYLIGDIVGLVPPPTLSPTRMFYGDANSVAAETNTLTYTLGGIGTVQADTTQISGTLSVKASSINNADSIVIGPDVIESPIEFSACYGVRIGSNGVPSTWSSNSCLGVNILRSADDVVSSNVAIGNSVANQSESFAVTGNVLIGKSVMEFTSNGISNNVFIGNEAGRGAGQNGPNNMINNVAIGYGAAGQMANGGGPGANEPTDNVAIGTNAGRGQGGNNNIHMGTNSGQTTNAGFFNIGIGANTLTSQTGSDHNVAVGTDALFNLISGNNNTAIGKAAGSVQQGFSNTTSLGHNSQPQANDEVVLGDNAVTTLRCNTQVISGLSDARDKDNIEELSLGLEFIMDLEPVSWDWDRRDGTMDGKKDSGFVAQEVDEVIQDWEAEDILPSLLNKNNNEAWEVGNAALIPVLVKAIQELKKELDSCKAGK